MSIHIQKTVSGFEVSGKLDKGVKVTIPDGYRSLRDDEDVEMGDMTFNILTNTWSPVTETQLAMSGFSGSKKEDFRVPPVRRVTPARKPLASDPKSEGGGRIYDLGEG